MPITNSDIEERVIEACEWLDAQKKPCFVKAARKYGVYKDRVQRRYLRNALSVTAWPVAWQQHGLIRRQG
jgi:hypothetical protein